MATQFSNNDTELDPIEELEVTAERVERFRMIHEDAVRDLREHIARARASGCDHAEIDEAIRRARQSVGRFTRLSSVDDLVE